MHVVRSGEAESDDEAVPQPASCLCRCFISKRDRGSHHADARYVCSFASGR